MNLLALDTVTNRCSAALLYDGEILSAAKDQPSGHSQVAPGLIRELLDRAGIGINRLDGIVVDSGPGSFTGLRIGLGLAQGLAYGAGIPLAGICSLESLAFDAADEMRDEAGILALMDARMGQVYCSCYAVRGGLPVEKTGPSVVNPGALPEVQGPLLVTGDGWQAYGDKLAQSLGDTRFRVANGKAGTGISVPDAAAMLRLCQSRGFDGQDPASVMATYVRNNIVQSG